MSIEGITAACVDGKRKQTRAVPVVFPCLTDAEPFRNDLRTRAKVPSLKVS